MGSPKHSATIDQFHQYGIHLDERTIYMGSEITSEDGESGTDARMAEKAAKNLFILAAISNEPITVIMNNLGGDVTHGLALYDTIKECSAPITMIVLGQANSMGSVILQAASIRLMSPNSIQMLHYGTLGMAGENLTVYNTIKEAKRVDKWMERMYLSRITQKHPNFTIPKIQEMLKSDTYLTAEKSVELGLADGIYRKETT